jgi:RNA polymerase sigma-70 factor (ECF subfamily)
MPPIPCLATTESLLLVIAREKGDPARYEDAWRRFHERFRPVILQWCRGRGLGDADADDVAQRVFTGLFRKLPAGKFDGAKAPFRAWLRAVTRNAVTAFLRGDKRPAGLLGDECSPENFADKIEAHDLLETALERTREQCANEQHLAAFQLCALDGESAAETAGRLNMSVSAVQQAVSRLRRCCQAHLERLKKEAETE